MCIEKEKQDKGRGDIMPPAVVERDRELYCTEMREYLQRLKAIPKKEVVVIARKNLMSAGIIDDKGNLTDQYSNSR